jgi:hypothetical protein
MRSKGFASFGQTLAENVDSAKIHGAVAQKPQLHTFLELYLRLNAMRGLEIIARSELWRAGQNAPSTIGM